ncbi:hypothetical protein V2I01_36260 [Micromonospora sp. BRA006-A]|nr:hypothetical protein [Micromonospora sp. BRA006-A]
MAASRAYFATCEADDVDPQPPYWPKWRHYARLFDDLYGGSTTGSSTASSPGRCSRSPTCGWWWPG